MHQKKPLRLIKNKTLTKTYRYPISHINQPMKAALMPQHALVQLSWAD